MRSGEIKPMHKIEGTACQPLAPNIQSSKGSCCPTTCAPSCEPRVRLKDYIRLKPAIEQTCFSIGEPTCEAEVMPAHLHCFTGSIRRRGECNCVLTIKPVRATVEGSVCFAWGESFWKLGDGRYEMDIMFDGCCSVTVGLDVIGCHQAVLGYEHQLSNACVVVPHCAPQIDDEPYLDNPNCESCYAQC